MKRNAFLHLTSSNTGQNNGILNFHLPHYRGGTKNDKRKVRPIIYAYAVTADLFLILRNISNESNNEQE